jgi:hypothetical protein
MKTKKLWSICSLLMIMVMMMVAIGVRPVSANAETAPVQCHVNKPDIKVSGDCNDDGTKKVVVTATGNIDATHRLKLYFDGTLVDGPVYGSGDVTLTHTGNYAPGTYKAEIVMEVKGALIKAAEYVCPTVAWGGKNVLYEKSSDPLKCHRPSDSTLMAAPPNGVRNDKFREELLQEYQSRMAEFD